MRVALFLLLYFLAAATAHAFDASVSMEGDKGPKASAPDFQAQIGQRWGDYRVFVGAELTRPSDFLPNSPHNYRAGMQYEIGYGLTLEGGVIDYCNNLSGYGKVTWQYDSEKR